MGTIEKYFIRFNFLLLLVSLIFGVTASWAFVFPEKFLEILPFYQLRPLHVSAAMFWIIGGAMINILLHVKAIYPFEKRSRLVRDFSIGLWVLTILVVFAYYGIKKFGGREYWEFPGWLALPLLLGWLGFMVYYFRFWYPTENKRPQYLIMWSTGMLFFFITFIEQNLWQISWFRQSFIREVTIQWKANGSMVGAWNQMIYGSSLFLMVKLSGDTRIAFNKKAIFFYFLGFTNLLFNWGHHIYNVPTTNWMRHVAYVISMTEWLIFINIIQGFKSTMNETKRFAHLFTYRFIVASEFWVFINLLLALLMSIPAINRYTHGTHITVAHAMGTTIGINTMILLASFGYLLGIDSLAGKSRKIFNLGFYIVQVSLFVFWICLIIAGILKGYGLTHLENPVFQVVMEPVINVMKVFAASGIALFIGFCMILWYLFAATHNAKLQAGHTTMEK